VQAEANFRLAANNKPAGHVPQHQLLMQAVGCDPARVQQAAFSPAVKQLLEDLSKMLPAIKVHVATSIGEGTRTPDDHNVAKRAAQDHSSSSEAAMGSTEQGSDAADSTQVPASPPDKRAKTANVDQERQQQLLAVSPAQTEQIPKHLEEAARATGGQRRRGDPAGARPCLRAQRANIIRFGPQALHRLH